MMISFGAIASPTATDCGAAKIRAEFASTPARSFSSISAAYLAQKYVKTARPAIMKRRKRMISERPTGPSRNLASPLVRSFIFCFSFEGCSAVLGTTADSRVRRKASARPTRRRPEAGAIQATSSAAGCRIEMQIDRVKWQAHPDKVAHVDPQPFGCPLDVHVICLYGKVQFPRSFQDLIAQGRIGFAGCVRARS